MQLVLLRIGKERVFFEAARALGKKVYVGKQKRAVLDALGDTLSAEVGCT
jgi:DNA cross-link repair 1A protein